MNKIQDKTPRRWAGVRFDVFTHNYALETLKKEHPQMVYLSYGETDDFAHDGRYEHYLKSAHNTDKMIQEIWEFLQSDPFYRDYTTLIITTDHGRGIDPDSGKQSWRHHGTKYKDSEYTWIAMLGKGIDAKGEINDGKLTTPTK
ncbi:alkaline phosphatase family protein [Balneicella halophila]|uniref:alkaline phosphatase family protein n=1 Tax=Balneicella halophila TaxID=1537566 RepID=UPI001A9CA9D6|nr:alkaline phosphatase family protein [Balneicella halophila]